MELLKEGRQIQHSLSLAVTVQPVQESLLLLTENYILHKHILGFLSS